MRIILQRPPRFCGKYPQSRALQKYTRRILHSVSRVKERHCICSVSKKRSAASDGVLGASRSKKTISTGRKVYPRLQEEEEEDFCSFSNRNNGNLEEDIDSSPRSLLSSLRYCAENEDLCRGSQLHSDIARMGLLKRSVFLGSALVNMYSKCGTLAKAKEVFDELPEKNVVSWNSLISGYAQHGLGDAALGCFQQMLCEGLCPDAVTFTCVLKASGNIRAQDKGYEVHDQVVKFGLLDFDVFVGTGLVDMYAKCGSLEEAQRVFDKLPVQKLVTWNALIAGYTRLGYGEMALDCYESMQLRGIHANAATFVSLLKSCSITGASDEGQELHASIVRDGLLQREKIGSALIDMYIKCGMLEKAKEVFEELLLRNEVVWNVLIGGCAQEGHGEESFKFFERMLCEGHSPDAVTYMCIVRGSCGIGALDKGMQIHARIVGDGLLEVETIVGTPLVDMYAKSGLMEQAREAFDRLRDCNVVSWTALIAGYAQLGLCKEALDCYAQMQLGGLYPHAATFACILKACGSVGASVKGQEIHAQIVRTGLFAEGFAGTAWQDMHTKCGILGGTLEAFEELSSQDIVVHNGAILGYAQLGNGEKTLDCFEKLQFSGLSPNVSTFRRISKACSSFGAANKSDWIVARVLNGGLRGCMQHRRNDDEAFLCLEQMEGEKASQDAITFSCVPKACGRIEAGCKGREIHSQILQEKMLLEEDVMVSTALVDMYCKCGMLAEAQKVFDKLPVQDLVSWNALITGYTQQAHFEEALVCFECMQLQGFTPNPVTFCCILKLCGNLGAICKGQRVHAWIVREGFLQGDTIVGNTLVDMYSNCGMVLEAQDMFNRIAAQDLVSWNSLIAGYAQLGECENVFILFDRMVVNGHDPDGTTFIYLLNACSHSGLLDNGQTILMTMSICYGMNPTLEHLNCIVDCLGRAGCLEKVVIVLKEMPVSASLLMWHTLLGACQNRGSVELGKWAFENALQLDESDVATYICMHNILAATTASN